MTIYKDKSGNSVIGFKTDTRLFGQLNHSECYRDYLVSGLTLRLGASAPNLVNLRDNIYLPGFDGVATTEQGFFNLHILHDIKLDEDDPASIPTFHVHWTHNIAVPSGNVKWQIEMTAARGYGKDIFGASQTVSVTQAAAVQYTHQITDDDEMPIPTSLLKNIEPDTQILCRIFRDPTDAADTFANDACLIGVDMHYKANKYGTFERNRPFTSARINITGA